MFATQSRGCCGQPSVTATGNVVTAHHPRMSNRLIGHVDSVNVGLDHGSQGASIETSTQNQNTYTKPTKTATNSGRYKRPATYDGKSNWQDYLVHFELTAEMNKWDSTTKAM
jgi:hypothetical protein